MVWYPGTQAEFDTAFPDDTACRRYLAHIRWPEGFRCPRCGHTTAWEMGTGLSTCTACRYRTSVTAGTIFQDTRYSLRVWFQAIWYVTSQKYGVSALGLQRVLGLGSYHTAWAWLHRLRRAMVRPGRDRLTGTVEVDETYWGASKPGKHGRGAGGKQIVLVAVAHEGPKPGRIRLQHIPDVQGDTIQVAVMAIVEPGSTIETDGLVSYRGLETHGYHHQVIRETDGEELLPHVHLVVSLLKRWLLGTHHGAIHPSHLAYYLDEFTFRFNRRTSLERGKLFYRVVEHAVQVKPLRGQELKGFWPKR